MDVDSSENLNMNLRIEFYANQDQIFLIWEKKRTTYI